MLNNDVSQFQLSQSLPHKRELLLILVFLFIGSPFMLTLSPQHFLLHLKYMFIQKNKIEPISL